MTKFDMELAKYDWEPMETYSGYKSYGLSIDSLIAKVPLQGLSIEQNNEVLNIAIYYKKEYEYLDQSQKEPYLLYLLVTASNTCLQVVMQGFQGECWHLRFFSKRRFTCYLFGYMP